MISDNHSSIIEEAKMLLRNASFGFGIEASLRQTLSYLTPTLIAFSNGSEVAIGSMLYALNYKPRRGNNRIYAIQLAAVLKVLTALSVVIINPKKYQVKTAPLASIQHL